MGAEMAGDPIERLERERREWLEKVKQREDELERLRGELLIEKCP